MDSQATIDAVREAGRCASHVEQRPRRQACDDAASEPTVTPGAHAERLIETWGTPVGGPEYTGRA